MNGSLVSSLCFLALATIALFSCSAYAEDLPLAKQIHFAGSDFAARAYNSWADEYYLENRDYDIHFNGSIGYLEAVNLLINNTNVIAATDLPLPDSYYNTVPDLQMFPIIAGAICPFYTFVSVGLVLDRATIAKMYMGQITRWNATEIQLTNPGIPLANAPITVVYRTDDSLSTYALSQALSSFSEEWRTKYGVSETFPAALKTKPNFRGAHGERGVASLSRLIQNAFSYVSSNYVAETISYVQYSRVMNLNGSRLDFRPATMQPVIQASENLFDSKFTANIVDLPLVPAFPLMTYSYLVLRMHSTPVDRCEELAVFLDYIDFSLNYTVANMTAISYGYGTLTPNIAAMVRNKLKQVTCGGVQMLPADKVVQPAPAPSPFFYTTLETFSGLTSVPYVPFYDYLGRTISASAASTLRLSTITSLYEDGNSSPSSKLTPSMTISLFAILLCALVGFYEPSRSSRRSSSSYFGGFVVLVLVLGIAVQQSEALTVTNVASITPVSSRNAAIGSQMDAAARFTAQYFNLYSAQTNVSYIVATLDEGGSLSEGDASAILANTKYFSVCAVGGYDSEITTAMVAVIEVYLIPFIATGARGNGLTDGTFKLFQRVIPSYKSEGAALASIVKYYGWEDTVAFIASSDDYGIGTSKVFKNYLAYYNSEPLAEERYFAGDDEFSDQLKKIRESLARVIVIIGSNPVDIGNILLRADDFHLIGDQFVWLTGTPGSTSELFYNSTSGVLKPRIKELASGLIGLQLKGGFGPLYEQFLDLWEAASPVVYPGAGKRSLALEAQYTVDAFFLTTHAFSQPFNTLEELIYNIRNANATGITGNLNLHGTQDRFGIFNIVNLRRGDSGDRGFVQVGDWFEEFQHDISNGVTFNYNIEFHDGTIIIPDLIIHNKLTYWSCEDKKMKTDKTGKRIKLDPPGPDAKNIDKKYRCDQFIDCYNLSDESGCTPSMPAAYIALGILLGLSIIFAVVCIIFTIVFGYIIRRRRVRTASPLFLIIIACACIVGFGSDYAYFGQDSPVSCIFRMWLVTLAVITMISSLFIKSFRVWRLYRAKSKIVPMPDWQLVILVILMVIPVIIINIVWSIVATPTASLIKVAGDKHFVCHAGGFTGDPIGYVFFALDIAYIGLILLFGVFLSIVTRNIISTFNESRLIAVSTYNLFFLGVIGIPVYLVLKQTTPLASWVIYEVCILYGFLSTLVMQFVPKMYGIVVIDKFKNTNLQLDEVNSQNTATNSAAGGDSSNPNALF